MFEGNGEFANLDSRMLPMLLVGLSILRTSQDVVML
jgi:hypothetical protein